MAPRASWIGHLKLSLVSIPIRLYNVVSSSSKVSLNQLHKGCNQRVRQHLTCPTHGKIERDDIVKGYECEKDKFVVLEPADLEKIQLETNKTVDLVQFVDAGELNPLYFDSAYYVAPDGGIADEAYRLLRDAMVKTNKVAIGRVIMAGREHMLALRVHGKGFALTTLHYAAEVRSADSYFEDIGATETPKDQLTLATQLIENHAAPFDPTAFTDRYEAALLDVVKAKMSGSTVTVSPAAQAANVIDLQTALRQSVAAARTKKRPAPSVKAAKRSKAA